MPRKRGVKRTPREILDELNQYFEEAAVEGEIEMAKALGMSLEDYRNLPPLPVYSYSYYRSGIFELCKLLVLITGDVQTSCYVNQRHSSAA